MDSNKYLEEMKKVQDKFLDFLDEDNNIEEKYLNLKSLFAFSTKLKKFLSFSRMI